MPYDQQLENRVRLFFDAKRIKHKAKRMMGGLCVMVKGKMCVGVEKNRLMARLLAFADEVSVVFIPPAIAPLVAQSTFRRFRLVPHSGQFTIAVRFRVFPTTKGQPIASGVAGEDA